MLATATEAGLWVNDVHSQLNATRVRRVARPQSLDDLRRIVIDANERDESLSIAGGRHAMGGQQFGEDAVLVDASDLRRVLAFDPGRGTVEVEAGIQWRPLVDDLLARQAGRPRQWGIAQKQTGADRLSIGGALSANAHGRGLRMKPFVGDVESFVLVDAQANVLRCSRTENPDLFRLAVGGYGLFGLVYSVTLRLAPRRKLRRVVREAVSTELSDLFRDRIDCGFLYGDFQFAVDPASGDFLRRGVFSCYEPVDDGRPPAAGGAELCRQDWSDLIRLAHVDKGRAYRKYADYYLATDGQEYWSDLHQLTTYVDDYHAAVDAELGHAASEVITEVYVPRAALADFLADAAANLRRRRADVIYGTVRLIERDDETFLPWAREAYACVVLNLHVAHTPRGVEEAAGHFRRLIDLAAGRGGSFYLTYHRFATRAQVEACYPQFAEFLRFKRGYDPRERFQSNWYRHYREMFAAGSERPEATRLSVVHRYGGGWGEQPGGIAEAGCGRKHAATVTCR